jgi:hypothetical protein
MQSYQHFMHLLRSGQAITSYTIVSHKSLISPHAQVHAFKLTSSFLRPFSRPHGVEQSGRFPGLPAVVSSSNPGRRTTDADIEQIASLARAATFRHYGARTATVGIKQLPRRAHGRIKPHTNQDF